MLVNDDWGSMIATGFVTIGQAPRDDILVSMLPDTPSTALIQHGALDGLSRSELQELQPENDETPFVTRLADGSEALVSKNALMPRLQSAVNRAESDGAGSVVVLCTGAFPSLTSTVPLIFPDRILQANVDALLPFGTIGVVMPHENQMELMQKKWATPERTMVGYSASPYSSSDRLQEIGRNMHERAVDLIVLDCMGFTAEMKATVAAAVDVPVILANRLVGRVIEELSRFPTTMSGSGRQFTGAQSADLTRPASTSCRI